jgi:flagellar FliJ protein
MFRFPWQTVLNWKRNLEELSQARLAVKAGQLRTQEEEIQALSGRRIAAEDEVNAKARQGIRADEYALYKDFAEIARQDLLQRDGRKKITLREMDEEREVLIRLTKEKKILEKLKEKKMKILLREMEKTDQKDNDERVTLRYRPRSG